MNIVSCGEAKDKGLKRYFTGQPCKHGHVAERYCSTHQCLTCHRSIEKRPEDRDRNNGYSYKWRHNNADRYRENERRYKRTAGSNRETWGKQHIYRLRARAKMDGIPFSITKDDLSVPEHCPVLRIPILLGAAGDQQNWPSVDRIRPELGYVRGNVRVISRRANTLKSDCTDPDELQAVVDDLRSILCNYHDGSQET